jgi:hypothetical protein
VKNKLKFLGYVAGLAVWLLFLKGCIEPFAPPEITNARQFLVVDGSLNTSVGASSQIRLSRTQNVYDEGLPRAELRAKVTVEGNKGSRYTFVEAEKGIYHLAAASYNAAEKFRLRIRTVDGKEFLSAFVPVVKTPPIDSLTYSINPGKEGVRIFVNTHDATNKTRFYRWSFDETWEYFTPLHSPMEVIGKSVVYRTENINTCWSSAKASTIVLGSTVKLTKDVVKDQVVTYVPVSSGKLRVKYSILVKQYGLTQEEYEYWNTLSKTTERTGSLFDPQPAQLTGNITCLSDPTELAFGYFGASTQQEHRLYVAERLGATPTCSPTDTLSLDELFDSMDLIVEEYFAPDSFTPEYVMGASNCTDCRLQGGTTKKPSFWK